MNRLLPIFMLTATVVFANPGASTPETADQRQARITTTDGTQVIGQLMGLQDGKYIIKSDSLGEVTIEDGKVKSITYLNADDEKTDAAAENPTPNTTQQADAITGELSDEQIVSTVEAVGRQIVLDPDNMKLMESLMEDPDILELFLDEEFVKDAESGNYVKMMNNEKLQNLVDNNENIRRMVDTLLGRPLRDPPPAAPATETPADTPAAE